MLTRRALVGAGSLGVLTAAASKAPFAFTSVSPVSELPSDPAEQNKAFVKMIGSTGEDRVIWKSRGVIYAVQPDGIVPLHGMRGTEQTWWRQVDDTTYVGYPSTLSFFTDLDSDEFINEMKNPITNETIELPASFIRHKEGLIYTPNGRYYATMKEKFPEHYPDKPLDLNWSLDGDQIRLQGSSRFPPILRQPNREASTIFANASEVFDPGMTRAYAVSSGWNIMAWSLFLNMGDIPGHLIWHFDAVKVDSVDDLDDDYLARARAHTDRFDESPETDEGPTFFQRILSAQEEGKVIR